MTKFRLYFNKDKETTWLNEMAAKGYALKSFFAGFYSFEKCEPGEYVYQIDFGSKMFSVSDDYREFMAENNIEIVCLGGYWIILRKRASDVGVLRGQIALDSLRVLLRGEVHDYVVVARDFFVEAVAPKVVEIE